MARAVWDIEDFRRRLLRAFPPRPFTGLVSSHGECADGIHLRREFSGRLWNEIPADALFHGSVALPLLEPAALVSFLPARILRSIQTWGRDSLILEFTLYFLCPGSEDEGWDNESLVQRAALFDPAQKQLVAELLRAILSDPSLEVWQPCARFGLTWWGAEETNAGQQAHPSPR